MIRPVPGLMIEQQPARVLRRLLVWSEARGESAYGKLAVLWVAANRSAAWGKTIEAVILQPRQFSAFNEDDRNRKLMLGAANADPPGWAAVDAVVELYEQAVTVDPTRGALHYYNPAVASPKWGRGHQEWHEHLVIGNHVFGVAGPAPPVPPATRTV